MLTTLDTFAPHPPAANPHSQYDFISALDQTSFFFDAQRVGALPAGADVVVPWRRDALLQEVTAGPGLTDISGGWLAGGGGGNTKLAVPTAFAVTLLSWALTSFPDAVAAADVVRSAAAVRWGADWLLKAAPAVPGVSGTRLVYQVGNWSADQYYWGRPEDITGPRPRHVAEKKGGGRRSGRKCGTRHAEHAYHPNSPFCPTYPSTPTLLSVPPFSPTILTAITSTSAVAPPTWPAWCRPACCRRPSCSAPPTSRTLMHCRPEGRPCWWRPLLTLAGEWEWGRLVGGMGGVGGGDGPHPPTHQPAGPLHNPNYRHPAMPTSGRQQMFPAPPPCFHWPPCTTSCCGARPGRTGRLPTRRTSRLPTPRRDGVFSRAGGAGKASNPVEPCRSSQARTTLSLFKPPFQYVQFLANEGGGKTVAFWGDDYYWAANVLLAETTGWATFKERSRHFVAQWICAIDDVRFRLGGAARGVDVGRIGIPSTMPTQLEQYLVDQVHTQGAGVQPRCRVAGRDSGRIVPGVHGCPHAAAVRPQAGGAVRLLGPVPGMGGGGGRWWRRLRCQWRPDAARRSAFVPPLPYLRS